MALYKSKAVIASWVKNSSGFIHIGHTYVCQCPIIFPLVHLGFQVIRLREASTSLEEIQTLTTALPLPHPHTYTTTDSGNL
jgi:hypothetical protein